MEGKRNKISDYHSLGFFNIQTSKKENSEEIGEKKHNKSEN